MEPLRIFIGYEPSQDIAYAVLKYSLEVHSSTPLDVRPLRLDELTRVTGFERPHDPLQSTEFTYTRFLIPHLCNYEGRALYMDCDMLCFGDIAAIGSLDLSKAWLRVVKQAQAVTSSTKMGGKTQTTYPRKNWSSLMLLNCARLTCWTKEAVETQTGAWLHRFSAIPDECIGDLPAEWNVLDRYDDTTRVIHYTEGGPWLPACEDHPYGQKWFEYRYRYRRDLVNRSDAAPLPAGSTL